VDHSSYALALKSARADPLALKVRAGGFRRHNPPSMQSAALACLLALIRVTMRNYGALRFG